MEKCLGKSTACGLERGVGPAAMIESAASVAGGGPQWAEGSQSLHYDPIGSMRNLTEKVKTEIPAYTLESLRIASIVEDARGQERLQQK